MVAIPEDLDFALEIYQNINLIFKIFLAILQTLYEHMLGQKKLIICFSGTFFLENDAGGRLFIFDFF